MCEVPRERESASRQGLRAVFLVAVLCLASPAAHSHTLFLMVDNYTDYNRNATASQYDAARQHGREIRLSEYRRSNHTEWDCKYQKRPGRLVRREGRRCDFLEIWSVVQQVRILSGQSGAQQAGSQPCDLLGNHLGDA